MNNGAHSDERLNRLPIDVIPNPYQNHNLNAIVWLYPLECQARQTRAMAYDTLTRESDRLYQRLLVAKWQLQRKRNKQQRQQEQIE